MRSEPATLTFSLNSWKQPGVWSSALQLYQKGPFHYLYGSQGDWWADLL